MRQPLWTWDELVEATGGKPDGVTSGARGPDISGVSIDTRTLEKGDLFVALRGDNQDGHAYVTKAFAKGAAAALVSADFVTPTGAGPLIRVASADSDPVLKALEKLGVTARARLGDEARIIAVTGSVGKTSTKEMLRVCLASVDPRTHASDKSYNNHWGVPLTLARMPRDTRFGVFEIGMNHPGEIRLLTKMVRPHVAIITTVGPVHLGFFKSVEEIADAKAEIFEGLEAPPAPTSTLDTPPSPLWGGVGGGGTPQEIRKLPTPTRRSTPASPQGGGGATGDGAPPRGGVAAKGSDPITGGYARPIAILNSGNRYFERLSKLAAEMQTEIEIQSFRGGNFFPSQVPDFRLTKYNELRDDGTYDEEGSEVHATLNDREIRYRFGAKGLHQAENSGAALLAIQAVGAAPMKCLPGLAKFAAVTGRGERSDYIVEARRTSLIDESYNANPLSMAASMKSLSLFPAIGGNIRRVAVLGDMRELGAESERLHAELLQPVRDACVNLVFLCGEHMQVLGDKLRAESSIAVTWEPKSTDLIPHLLAPGVIQPGDVIMVKGSLGTNMKPIVDALKTELTRRAGEAST